MTVETLTDITVSMVGHQELLDAILTINFIDHYRAYLQNYAYEEIVIIPLVNFESFITSQKMLNSAASHITIETGEQTTAPIALNVLVAIIN